jgi:UDP-N-acetylmuramoyl-L-alanyl-D-glutamate--2,6-diaminopimelate ligase
MTVRTLLQALERDLAGPHVVSSKPAALERDARGVTFDSRQVGEGWIFVALRGLKADGTEFVPQAVERGAAAIVAERGPETGVDVPWVVVADARYALAILAAEFYAHPSRRMQVVGITGTNGKTTTSYVLSAIFEAAGVRCGLMGTVTYRIGDREIAATRTTPEAPEVQRMLRQMADEGCGACVMEVSSHALALKRVDGIQFVHTSGSDPSRRRT